jgi:hypothetical protein
MISTEFGKISGVVLMRAKGPASHYLERPHLGFELNMSSADGTSSRTSHGPPANKEKINLC